MDTTLQVKFTRDRNGSPLAIIRNLPGADAELTPPQMRALAMTLMEAASDCRHQEPGFGRYWLEYQLPTVA